MTAATRKLGSLGKKLKPSLTISIIYSYVVISGTDEVRSQVLAAPPGDCLILTGEERTGETACPLHLLTPMPSMEYQVPSTNFPGGCLLFSFAKTKIRNDPANMKNRDSVQVLEEKICPQYQCCSALAVFARSSVKGNTYSKITMLFLSRGEEQGPTSHWEIGKSV